MNLVLLPGLDGTGRLFDPFLRAAPEHGSATRVVFPTDRILSYDELANFVSGALPEPPFVLLGESFSGPLALKLASRVQPAAVILCASYVRAAALGRLAAVPLSFLPWPVPPKSAIRALLSGGDAVLASDLAEAVRTVEAKVLASRVRMVLEVDVRSDLRAFSGPLLYLRATRDRVVPRRQSALVREIRPDADVAEIDGPHLLLQTRPAECWDSIRAFTSGRGI